MIDAAGLAETVFSGLSALVIEDVDVSITIFTASSLNSGEKLFFGRGKTSPFQIVHLIGWTVRKARGTSEVAVVEPVPDGLGRDAEPGGGLGDGDLVVAGCRGVADLVVAAQVAGGVDVEA